MSATNVKVSMNRMSVQPSETIIESGMSAPMTKSSWSAGIQRAPGTMPILRLKKLLIASPHIAPAPIMRPTANQSSGLQSEVNSTND